MGAGELILLLLSLSGFGVTADANAPSADEVLRYAPDDASYMLALDAQAVVPNNWAAFIRLPNEPAIAGVPELKGELQKGVKELEEGRRSAQQMLGFDPVADVKSIAAFVVIDGKKEPDFIIAVRGKF